MDKRLFEIECWVKDALNEESCPITLASSDASFRRYFRVTLPDCSYIVMDAPPDEENTDSFVYAGAALSALGLHAPRIIDSSRRQGLILLEDLGDRHYLDALTEGSADALYLDAIAAIIRLQEGPKILPDVSFPPYDEKLLREEMDLFNEWYVSRHLGARLDRGQAEVLRRSADLLTNSALQQPRTWVHRDFHSRNLMIVASRNPGIIDFQDMVDGPVTYDLVSLLKDCYIRWPRYRIERWVDTYLDRRVAGAQTMEYERGCFFEWFDLMGVQRHLKVLGIFARLNYRDGKPQYLDDLPLVLEYLLETCASYTALAPLNDLLLELHPHAEPA